MRWFRLSIAGMMALVLFLSLAFTALRYSSGIAAGITCLLSLGILLLAVPGVVYQRSGGRAFCLGFALFGWGYIAMAYQTWSQQEDTDAWGLVTTRILDGIEPSLHSNNDDVMDWLDVADADNRRIWIELNKPLSMPFSTITPLEEVIKYITTATIGPGLERGIPIYYELINSSHSEKYIGSPVILNLEGVRLKESLRLMLDQLDLIFQVRHGLMTIKPKSGGSVSSRQNNLHFRRVGHHLIALVMGCLGGLATRRIYATRDRREDRAASSIV